MMPALPRFQFNKEGTKFRISPQPRWLKGFRRSEIVSLNSPPGTIKAGPQDDRIYVIDVEKKEPYKDESSWRIRVRPPYGGPDVRRPVQPDPDGHFHRRKPGTYAFSAAAVFGAVRCVLEIWEHHFGRALPWFFRADYERLEVIPRVESNNAWSGEGFLEFGFPPGWDPSRPYCENFDTVAHEVGHLILKAVIGNPTEDKKTLEYRAHEEACADLVALVACLHLDTVVNRLVRRWSGKLFSVNLLSRIGEYRGAKEARTLFNDATMRTVEKARERYSTHGYSLPFSGAAFDVFVEIYERNLVERNAIPKDLAERSRHVPGKPMPRLSAWKRHFRKNPGAFREALLDARDYFARLMARAWSRTSVNGFSYSRAAANIIAADEELSRELGMPSNRDLIRATFTGRGILDGGPAEGHR